MANFDQYFRFARAFTGNWTPKLTDDGANVPMEFSSTGSFYKHGSRVWLNFSITTVDKTGLNGSFIRIADLPFTVNSGSSFLFVRVGGLTLAAGDGLPRGVTESVTFGDNMGMEYLPNDAQAGDEQFPVSKWGDGATITGSGFYSTTD